MMPPRSIYARKLLEFPTLAFGDEAAFQWGGRWREFFGSRIGPSFSGRVILEIGCFDADYLARIAAQHPDTAFIGLDWKCKALYTGAEQITRLGLSNVALLRARAQDIGRIFSVGELDEVWVFHPDPCDREVELPNRLIAEPFLCDLQPVLRDADSRVCLKTDHPGYYQWALSLFGLPAPYWFHAQRPSGSPRVKVRELMAGGELPAPSARAQQLYSVSANSPDFWHDAAALAHTRDRCFSGEVTVFESRFVRKNLPIYYLEWRKT